MADLLLVSVPSVLKNRENYTPRYAHHLAVRSATHLLVILKLFQCEAGLSSKLSFLQVICELIMSNCVSFDVIALS